MKKNKSINVKRIVILIIITIIIFTLIKTLEYINEKNLVKNGTGINSNLVEKYLDENKHLRFSNFEEIMLIKNISVSEVTNKINKLVKEEIPKLYNEVNELNDEKLKKYYNENKESLLKSMYLNTEEEFIKLVNSIKNLDCNLEDYKYCEYIKENSNIQEFDNADRFLFEFNTYYKNDKYINFKLEFIKYHK